MAGSRVLTKDLDARLRAVEERIGELAQAFERAEDRARQAQMEAQAAANRIAEAQAAAHQVAATVNGADSEDKLSRLEAMVGRLDDRVEKITHTLVAQASRGLI
jgi:chromosome segregation ATPase